MSLLINEDKANVSNNQSSVSIVFKEMEERFEIFVRKYPHKKSVQMLHIIEALIIVLNLWITWKAYNTRKANHSRRNSSNTILSKLGKIKEERILEYLLFIIKGNHQI